MAEFGEGQKFSAKDKILKPASSSETQSPSPDCKASGENFSLKLSHEYLTAYAKPAALDEKSQEPIITPDSYNGLPVLAMPWPRKVQPPGIHFRGRLYLRGSLLQDFRTGEPKPETLAILAHEHTHFVRLGTGFVNQVFRFWTKPKFRYQEELAATQEEMKVLKQYGKSFDIAKRAKDLSGFSYGWCTKYSSAKHDLEKMWNEV